MCYIFRTIKKKFCVYFLSEQTQHKNLIICHCVPIPFIRHILITTCLNFLIFAQYIGKKCFKCFVSYFLNNLITTFHFLLLNMAFSQTCERGRSCVTIVIENDAIP